MKKIMGFAALFLMVVVVLTAMAQTGGSGRHRGMFARHIANDLQLTADQRARIRQILQEERPKLQTISGKLAAQNYQIRQSTEFDESKVRVVAHQEVGTIEDLIVERERIRSRVFAVLTPEQRDKANSMIKEFRNGLLDRVSQLGDDL